LSGQGSSKPASALYAIDIFTTLVTYVADTHYAKPQIEVS